MAPESTAGPGLNSLLVIAGPFYGSALGDRRTFWGSGIGDRRTFLGEGTRFHGSTKPEKGDQGRPYKAYVIQSVTVYSKVGERATPACFRFLGFDRGARHAPARARTTIRQGNDPPLPSWRSAMPTPGCLGQTGSAASQLADLPCQALPADLSQRRSVSP